MKTDAFENILLSGRKEVYRLFRQSYVIEDVYRLPVWIGYIKSSKKEITIIPIEPNSEKKYAVVLMLFQREERFKFVELCNKNEVTFVILDVSPNDFEKIYRNLPVKSVDVDVSQIDKTQVDVPLPEELDKKKIPQARPKKTRSIIAVIVIGLAVCSIPTYLFSNLFSSNLEPTPTLEITSFYSSTPLYIVPPSDTSVSTQTPTATFLVLPTFTPTTPLVNTMTVTSVLLPTMKPSDNETATPTPTRTGVPGTILLCPVSSGRNVRSIPSTQNNNPIGSLNLSDCLYYDRQFMDNSGMIWVSISMSEIKFPGGWVAAEKGTTVYLKGDGLSTLPTPKIPPITFTPTSTPKVTTTP